MTAFVDRHETRTIRAEWWEPATDDLPAEEVVLRRLSYGDEQEIADRAMQFAAGESKTRSDVLVLAGTLQLNIMQRAIVSWTLRDGDKIAPLNFHNIKRLDRAYAQFIQEEIDRLNPSMTAEQREPFRGSDNARAQRGGAYAPPGVGDSNLPLHGLELARADGDTG